MDEERDEELDEVEPKDDDLEGGLDDELGELDEVDPDADEEEGEEAY